VQHTQLVSSREGPWDAHLVTLSDSGVRGLIYLEPLVTSIFEGSIPPKQGLNKLQPKQGAPIWVPGIYTCWAASGISILFNFHCPLGILNPKIRSYVIFPLFSQSARIGRNLYELDEGKLTHCGIYATYLMSGKRLRHVGKNMSQAPYCPWYVFNSSTAWLFKLMPYCYEKYN